MLQWHFDLLYIGNDSNLWSCLLEFSKTYDFTVLNMKSIHDIPLIIDNFSFTVVLTELHLKNTSERFIISKSGLRYSYIEFLIDDLNEKSINESNLLFGIEPKNFLLLKKHQVTDSLLKLKILNRTDSEVSLGPIEA